MRATVRILVAILLAGLLPSAAAAWVVMTGGEEAGDVLVDAQMNVLSAQGPVTKRSAPKGKQIWRFTDPAGGGTTLRLDPAGNVLVAGTFTSPGPDPFRILKINGATGAKMWAGGTGGGMIIGSLTRSLAVDGAGNALAAGARNSGFATGIDFVVMKVSGVDGSESWRYVQNGTTTTPEFLQAPTDGASQVVVDTAGDAFAIGTMENETTRSDATLVKLAAADGTELWQRTFDDGSFGHDRGLAVALDGAGNVIAASFRLEGGPALVVKLDADGNELWRKEISGARGFPLNSVLFVSVDPADDLYLGGQLDGQQGDTGSCTVVKLAGGTGNELWRNEIDYPAAFPSDVALDDLANVVAACRIGNDFGQNPRSLVTTLSPTTGAAISSVAVRGTSTAPYGGWITTVAGGTEGRVVASAVLFDVSGSDFEDDSAVLQYSERLGESTLDIVSAPSAKLSLRSTDRDVYANPTGTSGDPTVSGATLTLRNPTTLEQAVFALPAANWTATKRKNPRPDLTTYVYRDPAMGAGPCYSGTLSLGRQLTIRCRGLNGFTLDEATQGGLAATMTIGSPPTRYCMLFAAPRVDQAGRFSARKAPPPPACL
jgi:hypothetical protein